MNKDLSLNVFQVKVTAVTIMYGDRWCFLSQVLEAVMKDPYIVKFIIVDNGSSNKEEIKKAADSYGDRVIVLRQEKNLGSAGGFAVGIEHARSTDCDFVFLLDDDSVPEEGTIKQFLSLYKLFPNKKVVLSASRPSVPGNSEFFYKPLSSSFVSNKTFFEIFTFKKVAHFSSLLVGFGKNKNEDRHFVPIIPNESFVYGGAFIPIDAVRQAPLPDVSLFLYGDDIEYSWGIKSLGYESYVCAHPSLTDVDITFGGSHIFGIFDPKTVHLFKVYYRIRNMVRISVKHSQQTRFILFLNIVGWIFGLCVLGLSKYGFTSTYLKRLKLIFQAVYGGYNKNYAVPQEAQI